MDPPQSWPIAHCMQASVENSRRPPCLSKVLRKGMINLPRLMGIGIVLALLATQAQTAALAHSARESQTELMKKRMQTLFPMA